MCVNRVGVYAYHVAPTRSARLDDRLVVYAWACCPSLCPFSRPKCYDQVTRLSSVLGFLVLYSSCVDETMTCYPG